MAQGTIFAWVCQPPLFFCDQLQVIGEGMISWGSGLKKPDLVTLRNRARLNSFTPTPAPPTPNFLMIMMSDNEGI